MAEEKLFDQEFVEYVVKAIVDHPEDVDTERVVDEMGTLISLHVNAADMATIIGKEGRTAKSLRTVLRILGAKHNERINLKIIEPEGGKGYVSADVEQEPQVATTSVADALRDIPQDEIA